eukprot:7603215-Pyramimonas_sp.AAC.1
MGACVPLARKVTIDVAVVVVVVSTSSSSCCRRRRRRRRRGGLSYARCPRGVGLAITFQAMRTEVQRADRT